MAKVNTDTVRQAATGRWREILQSVAKLPAEILDDSQEHPCPKCGGETRFRLVDEAMGAVRCSHCFSERCGDGFAAVQWMADVSFPVAVNMVGEYLGIKQAGERDPARELKFDDWSSDLAQHFLAAKAGTTEKGLLLSGARMARYKKQYTVYAWPIAGPDLDPSRPVGWVVMQYNGAMLPRLNKQGVQVGQVKTKITFGSNPGLVGTHALECLRTPGLVDVCWKVEGITDLIALQGLIPEHLRDRHVVITNANGSKEKPRWPATALAAVNCNVIHDADKPGVTGGREWATAIASQAPEGIKTRFLELPYEVAETHGKDLRDWINDGGTYADLISMAEAADPIKIARTADGEIDLSKTEFPIHDLILKKLQLEVLYEEENGNIRVFSTLATTRKSSTIRDISRLKKAQLIQICGGAAKVIVSREPDNETTFSLEDIQEAIALAASGRRSTADERGAGVWQGLDEKGQETETLVLVGQHEGSRWNGDRVLRKIISPRADGLVLDFGTVNAEWYDFDQLTQCLELAVDVEWRKDVVTETVALFDRWRWKHQAIDPTLMAGLCLATWVQTIFRWRPLVSVGGESHSGKSLLFEAMGGTDTRKGLFGNLAYKSAKSSAAGILQKIGNTARVILCDEFEAGRERTKALEAFRQASRGEQTAKGTAHHRGVDFKLRHIFWVAATETGLEKQPDANRYVQFELLKAEEGKEGGLSLPDDLSYLPTLGTKLLAVAMRGAIEAKRMAYATKDTKVKGVDARMIESYAVPAAMLAVAGGYDIQWCRNTIEELTGNIDKADQGKVDHEQLMVDIIAAPVNLGGKGSLTVGQIMESSTYRFEYAARLELAGVKPIAKEGSADIEALFLVPRAIGSQLLRGGPWEGQRIDQILLRLAGVSRSARKVGGTTQRGLIIPIKQTGLDLGTF